MVSFRGFSAHFKNFANNVKVLLLEMSLILKSLDTSFCASNSMFRFRSRNLESGILEFLFFNVVRHFILKNYTMYLKTIKNQRNLNNKCFFIRFS